MSQNIDAKLLKKIREQTVERYSERLSELGESIRTLGWGSRQQQIYRFEQFLSLADYSNKVVLDVGCGFADFYDYLMANDIPIKQYIGMDINPDLLEVARKNHPQLEFIEGDPLAMKQKVPADLIVMSGVLNFRQPDLDNKVYARQFIECLFNWTRETVLIDMLSTNRDENYPQEDFVYYYDPVAMLEFAFSITPHVTLKHDYRSIPQREFILKLVKEEV